MTKRKRPMAARQRQAFYRKAVWWDGEKLVRGLQNRTPEVADAYLAMIAKQGAEIQARGEHILADYQAEEDRRRAELELDQGRVFFVPQAGPGTFFDATPFDADGETLAEKIKNATDVFFQRNGRA